MDEAPEPKISLPEAILIGIFLGLLDLIDLIPLAGDITDAPAALLFLYYQIKGISGTMFGIAWVLDLIPIVQEFPTRSIAWWISVYMDRHPSKIGSAIEQAGELTQGAKGGVGSEAAEGATAERAAATTTTGEAAAAEGATAEVGETAEISKGNVPSAEAAPEGEAVTQREGGRTGPEKESIEKERESRGAERLGEEGVEGEGEEVEGETRQKEEELERELETKEERPPEEVLEEQLFEGEGPLETQEKEQEEEEGSNGENRETAGPKTSATEFERAQKALEVKRQLNKLKAPGEITAEQDEDTLRDKAA